MGDNYDDMADEADKYADLLANMTDVDFELLRRGLKSDYDVIVSEALDYIIKLDLPDCFRDDLIKLSRGNESYLISGRLRLCSALSKYPGLSEALSQPKCEDGDLYCQVWETAACYVNSSNHSYLETLVTFTNAPDLTVASLARSLLAFLERKQAG